MTATRSDRTRLGGKIDTLWANRDPALIAIAALVDAAHAKYRPDAPPCRVPEPDLDPGTCPGCYGRGVVFTALVDTICPDCDGRGTVREPKPDPGDRD